ncbi:nitrous oxide reductase accessory protein NosL [Zhouia amylolytica]|nr:nitrous oxide reductase accessory protein NosL [Zhouia amylolytica]
MKKFDNILMLLAALLLLLLFVFPIWQITLIAPQYPDGISLYIWINQITGDSPSTLQNINILNHYVGMKFIEPDAIPELSYFPYIIGGMSIAGIVIAIWGKRILYLIWSSVLGILGLLGIYDFYLWEYDYGHNLSPEAPIKVPGMAYQPPLFGEKYLLNFLAKSYPELGTYFMFIAILLAFTAFFIGRRRNKKIKAGIKATQLAAILTLPLTIVSCEIKQAPINYGSDACHYCKMTIVDPQHAAELVNNNGKVFKYDAIECMVNFLQNNSTSDYTLFLVNDYQNPKKLIDAKNANYVISPAISSPMGANLSAFSERTEMDKIIKDAGGTYYTWEQLKNYFKNQ